jgi:hypothetical protein
MSGKPAGPEVERFNNGLRKALSVSKANLREILESEKGTKMNTQNRGREPGGSSSVPSSGAPG